MKKTSKSLLLAFIFFTSACGQKDNKSIDLTEQNTSYAKPIENISEYDPSLGVDYSKLLPQAGYIIDNAPSENINQLGFKIYNQLNTIQNISYSPLSLSSALALAYDGANGRTKSELRAILNLGENYSSFGQDLGNFVNLLQTKKNNTADYDVDISYGIWVQKNLPLLESFKKNLKDSYGIKPVTLSFDKEPGLSTDIINQVISNQTKGNIPKLFKDRLSTGTKVVLTNAVYFKDNWKYQFKKNKTTIGDFTNKSGHTIKANYMNQTNTFDYSEDVHAQTITLPYKDSDFAMVLVLPKESAKNFYKKDLKYEDFLKTVEKQTPTLVNVKVPKFNFRYNLDFVATLQVLGVTQAFTDEADFSNMTTADISISRVPHETYVNVDENGTSAAAATGVVLSESAEAEDEDGKTISFFANRPFVYYIIHNSSKAILFMGRVDNI